MTDLSTITLTDLEPGIRRAVDLVIGMRAEQYGPEDFAQEEPGAPIGPGAATGPGDGARETPDGVDDLHEEAVDVARELAEHLSAADPGSARQAAYALALLWGVRPPSEWSWGDLVALTLASLPVDHPHWALWADIAGMGPHTFTALFGPLTDDGPSPETARAHAYVGEVAKRHPDRGVRRHATAAIALHAVLQRTLGQPEEERHADLEEVVRNTYGDRSGEIDGVLAQLPEMLFDPDAFLREFPPGSAAPDFSLRLLNGNEMTLSDIAGSPVLMYFTGSWCAPCQIETPAIVALHAIWRSRGVEFLGIALEDSEEGFAEYLDGKGVTWAFGVVGEDHPILSAYRVRAFPTVIVLGPRGTVLGAGVSAAQSPESVEALLQQGVDEAARLRSDEPIVRAGQHLPRPEPKAGEASAVTVTAAGIEPLGDGLMRVTLTVAVSPRWKIYPPGSDEGIPLRLEPARGSDTELVDWALDGPGDRALTGQAGIKATVRPGSQSWRLELVAQACSGDVCLPPRRVAVGGAA